MSIVIWECKRQIVFDATIPGSDDNAPQRGLTRHIDLRKGDCQLGIAGRKWLYRPYMLHSFENTRLSALDDRVKATAVIINICLRVQCSSEGCRSMPAKTFELSNLLVFCVLPTPFCVDSSASKFRVSSVKPRHSMQRPLRQLCLIVSVPQRRSFHWMHAPHVASLGALCGSLHSRRMPGEAMKRSLLSDGG